MSGSVAMKQPWTTSETEWSTLPPSDPGVYLIANRLFGIKVAKVYDVAHELMMHVAGHEPTRLHTLNGWWWLPSPVDVPKLPRGAWEV